MITLCVLETNSTEEELLFKLASRGRHADIPYYYSVDDINFAIGEVDFTRLDCFPAPAFRTHVSGQYLIVSALNFDEVADWLRGWNVKFSDVQRHTFGSKDAVWKFIRDFRNKHLDPKTPRRQIVRNLRRRLR